MSAIQDLAPFIGAYQGKIRRAKDASGMTLEELSNESGVSFSAVSRLYAGTQADPRLYNSAALCKTSGCRSTSCSALKIASEARKS